MKVGGWVAQVDLEFKVDLLEGWQERAKKGVITAARGGQELVVALGLVAVTCVLVATTRWLWRRHDRRGQGNQLGETATARLRREGVTAQRGGRGTINHDQRVRHRVNGARDVDDPGGYDVWESNRGRTGVTRVGWHQSYVDAQVAQRDRARIRRQQGDSRCVFVKRVNKRGWKATK